MKPSMKMNAVVDFCTKVIARCQVALRKLFANTLMSTLVIVQIILLLLGYLVSSLAMFVTLLMVPYTFIYPSRIRDVVKKHNFKGGISILYDAQYYTGSVIKGTGTIQVIKRGSIYRFLINIFETIHAAIWMVFVFLTPWYYRIGVLGLTEEVDKELKLVGAYGYFGVGCAVVLSSFIEFALIKIPTEFIIFYYPNVTFKNDTECGTERVATENTERRSKTPPTSEVKIPSGFTPSTASSIPISRVRTIKQKTSKL